jgi:hypothetical protein
MVRGFSRLDAEDADKIEDESGYNVKARKAKAISSSVRLEAIRLWLSYSRGKPVQAVEVTGKDGKDLLPQVDEEALLEKFQRLAAPAPTPPKR